MLSSGKGKPQPQLQPQPHPHPPSPSVMATAASGDDAEGVELTMQFSETESAKVTSLGKQQRQKQKLDNGVNGNNNNKKTVSINEGAVQISNGGDDDDANTTATDHECCVYEDRNDGDADGKQEESNVKDICCHTVNGGSIPSILPPLTQKVYDEYRRDQELAEEERQKAKLMSTRSGQLCGIPYCMCIPFVLLIIAVIIGTIFAVINYDPSQELQPPTFAPTTTTAPAPAPPSAGRL